jgi:hypothetical protein
MRFWKIAHLAIAFGFCLISLAHGAGVTLITHGLNGNADGWVTAMAELIPNFRSFPGTNYTLYKLYFIPASGGGYQLTWSRLAGGQPGFTDSGEIIIALDWSQLADGNSYNTYQVATPVAAALLSPSFISEMNGHTLAELPLHLVGHSRGGSLISELCLRLGTNGVWVDHLTTLDPHPLNNDGFTLDRFLYSAVDAPAHTYSTVLFHDNYWQHLDSLVYGEPVAGAYVRQLTNLNGGNSSSHSDVHLWYHGTVDQRVPSDDTEAQITTNEFKTWYVPLENRGTNAGFNWSLLGRGDRTSTNRPVGSGFPAIRDGYNQNWDFGAGQNPNRTALATNNGSWASVMKFNLLSTNSVSPGDNLSVKYFYQWAQPATNTATISFYLDDDLDPWNGNNRLLQQINVPGNVASGISPQTLSLPLTPTNAPPGIHTLFVAITAAGHTRYLYAPETLVVNAPTSPLPPLLSATKLGTNIVLSWPTNSAGFALQWTSDLAGGVWSNSFPAPVIVGTQYAVTNNMADGMKCYRLKK